jgi:UDP-N-acetylmuramoylalanine--D-glutamate ligase
MTDDQWMGKKVTVIGFGIEGEDLARYFAAHGASVTVNDRKPADALATRTWPFEDSGVKFRLGNNDASVIEGADLVCVSQGVPLTNAAVVAARQAGIAVESMTSLFFDRYPGPTVGITGSSGKTTTTSLVDAIFTAAGRDHVLGGNIGKGLMQLLDEVASSPLPLGEGKGEGGPPWAIVEVSHTQLQLVRRSPHVAALLSVTPNHLDQFSWPEYIDLKRRIYAFQGPDGIAVFNADDPVSRDLVPDAPGRVMLFSVETDPGTDGAFLRDGHIFQRHNGREELVIDTSLIPLRGFHNVANVTAAAAIAAACDIGPEAVAAAVVSFKAPEHRLEFVARVRGADYYNDSIATAPERTVAALRSFEEPIVLLLGGREKHLPLDEMLAEMKTHCRVAVCFGEAGPLFADALTSAGVDAVLVKTLAEAVEEAAARAQAGDVVLLSPACTSFDAYDNFELRGADFRRLVGELAQERTSA